MEVNVSARDEKPLSPSQRVLSDRQAARAYENARQERENRKARRRAVKDARRRNRGQS